ncbi:hypothetical protein ACFQ7F_41170 [Streptomyces sp. NPDC056486]|uniref:hypothetical protein n=1 Tax=Streptomyces sp. NPDC056486 TaxID=3345835 RepID=UPI0036CE039A
MTAYGVATWAGFTEDAFNVPLLDRLAAEAAGSPEHHLRVIQLPVSLVMDTRLSEALLGDGPIVQAADRGWEVHASAPLHGGELLTMATPEVAALVQEGAGIADACLAAAASCPGVSRVLVATSQGPHWEDVRLGVGGPAHRPRALAPLHASVAAARPRVLTVAGMTERIRVSIEDAEPMNVVEFETGDGALALIIYGPGPDYCVDEVAFIPAEHRIQGA